MATLLGVDVSITFEISGSFEDASKVLPQNVNVTVGNGTELVTEIEARILSDTDGNGTVEPVPGENGLLKGAVTIDISDTQIFASFDGLAQAAGFTMIIEGLKPDGVAPGTIAEVGSSSGVNTVYTPTYDPATGTLTLNWSFFGFQPGTHVDQTIAYDNNLEDPPVANDDTLDASEYGITTGLNVLANDTDADNSGAIGIVDPTSVGAVEGNPLNVGQWVDLGDRGRVKIDANGELSFDPNGKFSDLADGDTRTVTISYTATDTADLTDTATVSVTVTGVNLAPVVTTSAGSSGFVEADGGVSAPVAIDGALTVVDSDSPALASATITITGNFQSGEDVLAFTNDPATMGDIGGSYDSATGVLTLTSASTATVAEWQSALRAVTYTNSSETPDTAYRTISIVVNDGSVDSATANRTISVTSVDDTPVISSPLADQSFAEDSGVSFTLPAGSFTDVDSSSLTYTAKLGDGSALPAWLSFTDSTLAFSGTPPQDFNGTLDITVAASDGTSSTADTFSLTITPVNDAPVITSNGAGPTASTSINENVAAVTIVTATDVDGDTLTYSISGGDDAALFDIDSTGQLSFIAAPDFEVPTDADGDNVYEVTVSVEDPSHASDSQTLSITITGVDEKVDITSPSQFSIVENTLNVGSVVAIDPEGAAPSYSISGGADKALFAIDSATGLLSFLTAPDFEKPNQAGATSNLYDVEIQVSDGTNISTQTIAVTVTNAIEAPPNAAPRFTGPNELSIGENQFVIASLAATDPDGDTLSYAIAGGDDAALFAIDAKTGELSFIQAPDFEAPGSAAGSNDYQVRVEVSDGSRHASNLFHVSVTDSDDEKAGTDGNDVFHAGVPFGNFHGDAGRDTVIFKGSHDDYVINVQPDGTVTVAHGNGIDTLSSIERLQFDDGTLAFDADGNAGQMFRLYQAAFGREPDPEGLGYWIQHQDAGQSSFEDVARSFMASPEFEQRYGSEDSLSNSDFIDLLYQNVLGRDPDADGFAYWLDKLDTGQTNFGDLLAFFSDSNENVVGTADAVSDGIWFV